MPYKLNIIIDNKKIEKILLKARKTIDGNIIISDHPDMDIVIYMNKNKVVSLPKEELDDEVYDSQSRLFKYLSRQGVVDVDSIQAGNLFMSMEAAIPDASKGDKVQYVLYAISNFIEDEMPYYEDMKKFEKETEKNLLEPETDEYTEFTPDLHADTKGTLPPKMVKYGIHSIYRV
tara:strand:+ start:274 stop:798 length:525 start_codon:yes stop_codon:yes gene_type:complete